MADFKGPGGQAGTYSYIGTQLSTVAMASGTDFWEYDYVWSGDNVISITYKLNGRQVEQVRYGYVGGYLETIKSYENSAAGTGIPDWGTTPVQATRFSYNSKGLLRHVVPPTEYQQMVVNGIDPTFATEAQLNAYAETEYEYDDLSKVSRMFTHGRAYQHLFAYTYGTLPGSTYNTWRMKTEVTRPDGSVETFFLNGVGQVMLKRIEKKDPSGTVLKTWYPAFQRFQEDGGARIVLAAAASAIDASSFDEADPALVSIKSSNGLVTEYIYNSLGLLQYKQERKGTLGTPVRLMETTYATRTVAGLGTVNPVATETVYRNDDATGGITTSYAYEWFSGTLQMSKRTTTMPVVSTGENGSGVAAQKIEEYDVQGYLIKSTDAVGTVTVYQYDKVKGALIQKIEDQGTGYLNLQTDYELDDRGRMVCEVGPQHLIDIAGVSTSVRSTRWNYYKEREREQWTFQGYRTTAGTPVDQIVGPVTVSRQDLAPPTGYTGWRQSLVFDAVYTASGIPSPTYVFNQADWQRWQTSLFDQSSKLKEIWTYFSIPASGYGSQSVNYGKKLIAYNSRGLQNQTTCAGGTIDRTTFNEMDWAVQEELGTAAGLSVTEVKEYDENGNIIKITLPVDATSANDRVTENTYDWRNRLIQSQTTVEKDGEAIGCSSTRKLTKIEV